MVIDLRIERAIREMQAEAELEAKLLSFRQALTGLLAGIDVVLDEINARPERN